MFDPICYVEIPANKLREAIKLAYDYSSPQGLGFLHARYGRLDEQTVDEIINCEDPNGRIAASMDYVHGRACKFTVIRHERQLFIRPRWYDHSDNQLESLLADLGIADARQRIDAANEAQRLKNEKWERENAAPPPFAPPPEEGK